MSATHVPNTLGVKSVANRVLTVDSVDSALDVVLKGQDYAEPIWFWGDGSNVVPLARLPGTVIRVVDRTIRVLQRGRSAWRLRVAAGCDWHTLVRWSVGQGLSGLESMALIPGTVGAAPVQNIGAYGTELSASVLAVHAVDVHAGERVCLDAAQCGFGYRQSVFRGSDRWLIVAVDFELQGHGTCEPEFPEVRRALADAGGLPVTPARVMEAVIAVRRRKLPDVRVTGNVGSFFKNPVVDEKTVDRVAGALPDLVTFDAPQGTKLAAAQLIDKCGWKGRIIEGVQVWPRQPLVLCNAGATAGETYLRVGEQIAADVWERFGVRLEREPLVLGEA